VISMRCVVLFLDVHDFSKAAVRLGERLGEFMQAFYDAMGEHIVQAHGTIVKYIGDAMLAVFADKAEVPAVRCALAMRSAFAGLVAAWGLDPATVLEVGITAGRVVRGTFGHRSLRIEDVFGEAVNTATVIGHIRGVTVTEPVQARIRDTFVVTPLAPRTLKWREEPLPVWAVAGEGSPPADPATGRG
jgi:adenylate cyclase